MTNPPETINDEAGAVASQLVSVHVGTTIITASAKSPTASSPETVQTITSVAETVEATTEATTLMEVEQPVNLAASGNMPNEWSSQAPSCGGGNDSTGPV